MYRDDNWENDAYKILDHEPKNEEGKCGRIGPITLTFARLAPYSSDYRIFVIRLELAGPGAIIGNLPKLCFHSSHQDEKYFFAQVKYNVQLLKL